MFRSVLNFRGEAEARRDPFSRTRRCAPGTYLSRGRFSRGRVMPVAVRILHTTSKSEYQATCTSARIALHAGAIPHQPGIAALAAHLALAVVRPGEPGLVQVTLRASRSAKTGARAPRFSARSRRRRGRGGRSGRRRVIAVKLPSQRFKSNEMPVAPDRVCPIRSSPFFWTVRRSNRSGFAPLGAGRNRAGTPGRCRRSSEHVPHLRDRLVRSDAGRRILTGDGEGALAGMRVGAVLHPSGSA